MCTVTGDTDSVYCNRGDTDSVYCNTGDTDSVYCNTGDTDSVYCNTGDTDSVNCNRGDMDIVYCNRGRDYPVSDVQVTVETQEVCWTVTGVTTDSFPHTRSLVCTRGTAARILIWGRETDVRFTACKL